VFSGSVMVQRNYLSAPTCQSSAKAIEARPCPDSNLAGA